MLANKQFLYGIAVFYKIFIEIEEVQRTSSHFLLLKKTENIYLVKVRVWDWSFYCSKMKYTIDFSVATHSKLPG